MAVACAGTDLGDAHGNESGTRGLRGASNNLRFLKGEQDASMRSGPGACGICFGKLNKNGRGMAKMLRSCDQGGGRIYV